MNPPDTDIPTFDLAGVDDVTAWFQARWPNLRAGICQNLAADFCADFTLISNSPVED